MLLRRLPGLAPQSRRVSIELGTGLATGDIRHPFDRSSGLRFRSLLGNTRTYVWVVGVYQYSQISVPQYRLGQPNGAPKGGGGGPADPSPGHVGVFGGVLISQRRPTRRGWDGGRRRPILVRKQRVRTPLLGGLVRATVRKIKSPRVSIELGTGLATGDIRHPFDRSSGLRFRSLLGNTRTYVWVVGVYQYSQISVPQYRLGQPNGAPKGGGGGPADPSPGHVGVFGGVLISQRRPTRRGWDGGRRRPILVRKQRGRAPPPQSTGVPVEGGLAGRRYLTGPSRVVTTRLFSEIYWPTGSLGTANRRNRPSKVGYDLSTK